LNLVTDTHNNGHLPHELVADVASAGWLLLANLLAWEHIKEAIRWKSFGEIATINAKM